MSRFITFEGTEGCGKTTQITLLAQRLEQSGYRVRVTREPGGCPISNEIRRILLEPSSAGMDPRTELLLYAAARAQHVAEVIRPALQQGEVVLCDRFSDATFAYQGFGRNLDQEMIVDLDRLATGGLTPDLTLLLDIPLLEGLERAQARNAGNHDVEGRFEQEDIEFHQRVHRGYQHLAKQEERFRVIPASGSVEQVFQRILGVVEPWMKGTP